MWPAAMLVSPKFQSLCQPKLKDTWVFFIDSTSNISRRNPFLLLFFPNCTTVVIVLFFYLAYQEHFIRLRQAASNQRKNIDSSHLTFTHLFTSRLIK